MQNNEFWSTKICVCGAVIWNNQLLFLHRKFPPINWCLPGGAAFFKENLEDAVRREIFEETALCVDEVIPIDTWQGESQKDEQAHVLSVTYFCRSDSGNITLSHEHDGFRWVDIHSLLSMQPLTGFNLHRLLVKLADRIEN